MPAKSGHHARKRLGIMASVAAFPLTAFLISSSNTYAKPSMTVPFGLVGGNVEIMIKTGDVNQPKHVDEIFPYILDIAAPEYQFARNNPSDDMLLLGCTATLVGPNTILFAAHCLPKDFINGSVLKLRDRSLLEGRQVPDQTARYRCLQHNRYTGKGSVYDIALCIRVERVNGLEDPFTKITQATNPQKFEVIGSVWHQRYSGQPQVLGFGGKSVLATGYGCHGEKNPYSEAKDPDTTFVRTEFGAEKLLVNEVERSNTLQSEYFSKYKTEFPLKAGWTEITRDLTKYDKEDIPSASHFQIESYFSDPGAKSYKVKLCDGDSGGPLFMVSKDDKLDISTVASAPQDYTYRRIIGVNARIQSDYNPEQRYAYQIAEVVNLNDPFVTSFFRDFTATFKDAKICGINVARSKPASPTICRP